MPSLLIRDVDDALHAQLLARARTHRRSLGEEAREMLRAVVARDAGAAGGESLSGLAARFFGTGRGVELDLPPRGTDLHRAPPDFAEPASDR